jgi:hypothetical protein
MIATIATIFYNNKLVSWFKYQNYSLQANEILSCLYLMAAQYVIFLFQNVSIESDK